MSKNNKKIEPTKESNPVESTSENTKDEAVAPAPAPAEPSSDVKELAKAITGLKDTKKMSFAETPDTVVPSRMSNLKDKDGNVYVKDNISGKITPIQMKSSTDADEISEDDLKEI